jgi:hypothetical protein
MARQAPGLIQPPVAGREEHVVHARRGVAGQLQDRLAPLVAKHPADGREQPLAPVPGVTGRQPPIMISGIHRPQVPDLMTLNIHDPDQVAAADPDRAARLGRHPPAGGHRQARHAPPPPPPAPRLAMTVIQVSLVSRSDPAVATANKRQNRPVTLSDQRQPNDQRK